MEEDNSMQHEKDTFVLASVKQKQDHGVEAKSASPVLRIAPCVTNKQSDILKIIMVIFYPFLGFCAMPY